MTWSMTPGNGRFQREETRYQGLDFGVPSPDVTLVNSGLLPRVEAGSVFRLEPDVHHGLAYPSMLGGHGSLQTIGDINVSDLSTSTGFTLQDWTSDGLREKASASLETITSWTSASGIVSDEKVRAGNVVSTRLSANVRQPFAMPLSQLAIGDFNADGHSDLLAVQGYQYSDTDISTLLTRYYDPTSKHLFGSGWGSTFDLRLYNGISIYYPDHGLVHFGDDGFAKTPLVRDYLQRDGTDYRLIRSDGSFYTFNSLGQVSSITSSGKRVDVVYRGERPIALRDESGALTTLHYNTKGYISYITIPAHGTIRYHYDLQGRLSAVRNEYGDATIYGYDDQDHLIYADKGHITTAFRYSERGYLHSVTTRDATLSQNAATDNVGAVAQGAGGDLEQEAMRLSEEYLTGPTFTASKHAMPERVGGSITQVILDEAGRIIQRTDPLGRVERIRYDDTGQQAIYTDATDARWKLTYNEAGQLVGLIDPLRNTWSYTYDSLGRRTSVTNPIGETIVYRHDDRLRQVIEVLPSGTTTMVTYDTNRRPIRVVHSSGYTTVYRYDDRGNLLSVTDPSGTEITYTYDSEGRLWQVTDGLNHRTTYAYTSMGVLERITHPDGNVTHINFNPLTHTVETIDRSGATTRYGYDSQGRIVRLENALGERVRYLYDEAGRLHRIQQEVRDSAQFGVGEDSITSPSSSVELSYNARGQLISVLSTRGYREHYVYDTIGRLIRAIDARGFTSTYVYDDVSQVLRETDPLGVATQYAYDSEGRLKAVVRNAQANTPADSVTNVRTQYQYDNAGNLSEVNIAGTPVYRATYDAEHRRVTVTDHNGATTRYEYNAAGNVVSVVLPSGMHLHYTYDARNRITHVHSDSETIAYHYDDVVRQVTRIDTTGQTTVTYDALYRPVEVIAPTRERAVYYYDPPIGTASQQDVFHLSALLEEKASLTGAHPNGHTHQPSVTLLANGLPVAVQLSGGEQFFYQYDLNGNLTSLRTRYASDDADNALSIAYAYDGRNQVTHATFLSSFSASNQGETLSYDALGRLQAWRTSTGHEALFRYNDLGRLTTLEERTGVWSYRTQFAYDWAGQLIADSFYRYDWDTHGNLTSIRDGIRTVLPHGAHHTVVSEPPLPSQRRQQEPFIVSGLLNPFIQLPGASTTALLRSQQVGTFLVLPTGQQGSLAVELGQGSVHTSLLVQVAGWRPVLAAICIVVGLVLVALPRLLRLRTR
jgi:YD repeat-containing protein